VPQIKTASVKILGDGERAAIGYRLCERLRSLLSAGISTEAQLVYFL